jgi:hypothetical protein
LGYTVQAGQFPDQASVLPTIRAFLAGIGWNDADWYLTPAVRRYMTSIGESGVEDIRCLLYINISAGSLWLEFDSVDINGAGYHAAPSQITGLGVALFPMPYYLFGDLDCFGLAVLYNGNWDIMWTGKVITTYPDETIIPHEYKQGSVLIAPGSNNFYYLRERTGLWYGGVTSIGFPDTYSNSSPNLIDGATYVLWPVGCMVDAAAPYWIFGIYKYIYRLSGMALSVGDTVQIGGQTFQYLMASTALRIA